MKKYIENILKKGILKAGVPDSVFDHINITVEYTKDEKFGDYTSNIAMVLAKSVDKSPMEIAEAIKLQIANYKLQNLEKIEVAAPGYINFYISKKYLQGLVLKINSEKNNFGNSEIGNGIKVNNEFISANPTGPLHLGNGRGGFFGDSLSKILKKAGFDVSSEYYINDAGGQIEKLGHSVLKDQDAVYKGKYIDELNEKYSNSNDIRDVGKKSATFVMENIIKKTVSEKMKISFDFWTSEQEIFDQGYCKRAIDIFKEKGLTYELEGALWLKTTSFGDDKDRVLIKSDGKNAYLAGDAGYILNKIDRGYQRFIMGLGADHHGYVSRIKAIASALGFDGDFRIIISQMVRLVKDGKEVRMSKRAGNSIDIDDLIDEIGNDVARFFFLMYSPDSHMNFDLNLAKEQSQKNPIFYVQYAHARICSILAKSEINSDEELKVIELLKHEKEIALIRELDKFPGLIEEISNSYAVYKLPHYAIKIADKFHSFYNECRVIDAEDEDLSKARLMLINAVRIVLGETLSLIGVSAPEKM